MVVLLLIVHLLLGFRRLREIDYIRDDPLVLRIMGLRRIPDVSTVSRALAKMEPRSVANVRRLARSMVIDGLKRECFPRLTMDFDGSVQSTKGHAEGTAVGFNKKKKGARSYIPLFCTIAQTGQFFDVLHRSGNVHDSNGAAEFMMNCFRKARAEIKPAIVESRMDSAFFNENIISKLNGDNIRFTASVPFARFTELKEKVESCENWREIDREWSYFETRWKPRNWNRSFRFIFIRKRNKKQRKGPLQLQLFEPVDFQYDYKVVVTNKTESANAVVLFHNGRGSQEAIFGDAKNHTALGSIPCRTLSANQTFTLTSMMAHNLSRELQMIARPCHRRARPKRPAAWKFEKLDTIRHRFIQRAGRLIRPQGKLTLSMSANEAAGKDIIHFMDALKKAA